MGVDEGSGSTDRSGLTTHKIRNDIAAEGKHCPIVAAAHEMAHPQRFTRIEQMNLGRVGHCFPASSVVMAQKSPGRGEQHVVPRRLPLYDVRR
jgi:hypothetical protein